MIPNDRKYTKDHEWVKLEGAEAVMGITDHAQSQLGDITFVELPKTGRTVRQAESIASVESVKAASDIYSGISGEITSVNAALNDSPEIINKAPYDKGWICRIKVKNADEMKNLMDAKAYEALIAKEK